MEKRAKDCETDQENPIMSGQFNLDDLPSWVPRDYLNKLSTGLYIGSLVVFSFLCVIIAYLCLCLLNMLCVREDEAVLHDSLTLGRQSRHRRSDSFASIISVKPQKEEK